MNTLNELIAAVPRGAWLSGAGLLAAAVVLWLLRAAVRLLRRNPAPTTPAGPVDQAGPGDGRWEDRLTLLVAGIATVVSVTGMLGFFQDVLHITNPWALGALCGFIELSVAVSALRARRNLRNPKIGTTGADGAAMWALTALTGVLSALHANSFAEVVFRLAAPFVAAWLWERGMSADRAERAAETTEDGGRRRARVHYRITKERLLVALRLADPVERTVDEVAKHRRVAKLARAIRAAEDAPAPLVGEDGTEKPLGWWPAWRRRRALRRIDRANAAAIEHGRLATDEAQQANLLAQLGALGNGRHLVGADLPAPWATAAAQSELAVVQGQITDARRTLAKVEETLAGRSRTVSDADTEIAGRSRTLTELTDQITATEARLAELAEARERTEQELAGRVRAVSDAEQVAAGRSRTLAELEAEIEAARTRVRDLANAEAVAQDKVAGLCRTIETDARTWAAREAKAVMAKAHERAALLARLVTALPPAAARVWPQALEAAEAATASDPLTGYQLRTLIEGIGGSTAAELLTALAQLGYPTTSSAQVNGTPVPAGR